MLPVSKRYIESEELTTIPMSAGIYQIDVTGKIIEQGRREVPTTLDENGDVIAEMFYSKGWGKYRVAILIALTFKPISIPFNRWDELDVLFVDENRSNIHPSNLVWKFPVGMESHANPGYAFIPGFTKYCINKEGSLRNVIKGTEIKGTVIDSGRTKFTLIPDIGPQTTMEKQRLLCLAWKELPLNVEKFHVANINGDIEDISLDNLEWVKFNAMLNRRERIPVFPAAKEIFARSVETGKITSYYTEAAACKALGMYRGAIRMVTNIPKDKRKQYNGYDIRLAREGNLWDDTDIKKHADVIKSAKWKTGDEDPYSRKTRDDGRKVESFNVRTYEVKQYFSLADCARDIGMCIPAIHAHLAKPMSAILPGYVLIRESKGEVGGWRKVYNDEIEAFEHLRVNAVLVRDVRTGAVTVYDTTREAADALGLDMHQLRYRLSVEGQPVWPGYIQLQRQMGVEEWRVVEDIEAENDDAVHGRAVLCKNVQTGEITEYPSARSCAFALGLSELTVAVRLRNSDQKVYGGGLQFKKKSDPAPWRDVASVEDEMVKLTKPVKVKDIFTGQVWEFPSIREASATLRFPLHVLGYKTNVLTMHPYLNYAFRFDDTPWKEYSERDLKLFKQAVDEGKALRGRGFILTDIVTGEEKLYTSRKHLQKEFGLTPTYINVLAMTSGILRNQWRIKYYF